MTNPIVVGIDGSPESSGAAEWAGHEAVRRDLPVHLLNIWQSPAGNVRFSPGPEALRLWEESELREAAKRLTDRHPGLTVTTRQACGTPVSELLDAAATSEMVVLGSRGLGGISGFFQGSAGLHVVARANRPVVLVRAEPPDSGGSGEVVLGLDLGRPCDALISFAFEEAATRGTVLRTVHVYDERKLYGYAAPALDPGLSAELRAEQVHEFAQTLGPWRGKYPAVEVRGSMIDGLAAPSVIEAAKNADLLVVGRRRRHSPAAVHIGPVTHAVLHHAVCPVAVVSHD
jgi:nucleotide-binding universal stress UspA family protein